MRYALILIGSAMLVGLAAIARADTVIADGVISTSLVRVLAHPDQYKGKRIELIGFYVSEFEHHALYLTKDDPEVGNIQNGIWVGGAAPVVDKTRINTRVKRGFVRVIGTFTYDARGGSGHLGMWPGEINNVTFLNTTR
jgi:hypothetical protein